MIFKEPLRKQLDEMGVPLSQIQFYNTDEIVLYRDVRSADVKVTAGKIKLRNGRYVEEVIIPANTPGVCESDETNKVKVHFEDGDERGLNFARNSKDSYQISAKEWVKKHGKVEYDGKTFFIEPGGHLSLLYVKKSQLHAMKKKSRVAKGVRVR